MATYGSSSTAGMGTAGSGQLRGSVYGVWPDNAWVTSITALLGKVPGGANSTARMGLYTTSNENPDSLVGQSAAFTVSNDMGHGEGGQTYTQPFSGGALRVSAGGVYAIGVVGTGGSLNHAMVHAASSPFSNKNLYYRNGVTGSLPNPFGYTSSSYEGNISAYVTYTVNRAPSASTISPSGRETSTSVTFTGGFSDPDSGFGDRLSSYEIELWNSSSRLWTSGWRTASSTEAQNARFSYTRTTATGALRWRVRVRDRFNETSSWSAWRTFNVQSNQKPTATALTPTGLQQGTNITFSGTFNDPDVGEQISRFRWQVANAPTGSVFYDSGWLVPNSAEVAANKFTRTLTLGAGSALRWRCIVQDRFGTQSDWTAFEPFSINTGGGFDTLSGVTGKQDTVNPTPFTAVWRHAGGLSANQFRIRILQGTAPIRTSGYISATRAPDTTISIGWSTAFPSYNIPWGTKQLHWQIQGRDTAGVTSAWMGMRPFHINSAPNVPVGLAPTNSAAYPIRPLLRCRAIDDDEDSLTVKARIKDDTGEVLSTRTMTLDDDGWYRYQTVESDLPSYGTYRWDAYAGDGVLWSGEWFNESSAQKSTEAVFVYANVPNVQLVSPTQSEVYAGYVAVEWQPIPNQQAARVTVLREDGSQLFQWGWTTKTSGETLGFSAAQYGWRKGETYTLVLDIRDTNGLVGSSEPATFSIDYETPNAIEQFVALPEFVGMEQSPSSIRLTWQPYQDDDFVRYTVTRNRGGLPVVLAEITNPFQTEVTDFVPPAFEEVEYVIVLTTLAGIDELESEPSSSFMSISIDSTILQSVSNPTNHVSLRFTEDFGIVPINDGVQVLAWGAKAPTMVYGTTEFRRISGTILLIDDEFQTAQDQLSALRSLWTDKQTICFRDQRGVRMFGHITGFAQTYTRINQYEVDLEITETQYEEGVA